MGRIQSQAEYCFILNISLNKTVLHIPITYINMKNSNMNIQDTQHSTYIEAPVCPPCKYPSFNQGGDPSLNFVFIFPCFCLLLYYVYMYLKHCITSFHLFLNVCISGLMLYVLPESCLYGFILCLGDFCCWI